jgi:MATE family multidrug resistance protein
MSQQMYQPDSPSRFTGLREVLKVSAPASMSMLNGTITRFIDGIMVAKLGAEAGKVALAAQGVAGIMAFAPEALAMGTLSVVNTFVSQNLGAGRLRRCGQYTWSGLTLALMAAMIIFPVGLLVARPLFSSLPQGESFSTLIPTERLVSMEIMYFRYMVFGALLTLPSRVIEGFLFGIHRPMLVFFISLVSNAFNIVGNYALIYGKWGLPRLELEGAAIASVASWGLQLVILLVVFMSAKMNLRYSTRRFGRYVTKQWREIFRIGWPAGVQFFNDVLSWAVFNTVLVGFFGAIHLAASQTVIRYMSLSFMPAVGIGIAATAIVGRYIGERKPDLARARTRTAVKTAVVYMSLCGLAFLLLGRPLMILFASQDPNLQVNEVFIEAGRQILALAAIFQLFDALGIVYVGALRGAGDTRWPMLVTMVLSWGVTVGVGWAFVVFMPQLAGTGPWIAASAYVIILGLLVAWRFEGGAWRRIDLLGRKGAELEPAALEATAHAPLNPDRRHESVDVTGVEELSEEP